MRFHSVRALLEARVPDPVAAIAARATSYSTSDFQNNYNAARTGVTVVSIGAIVGIVIGVIVLISICIGVCCLVHRQRKGRKTGSVPVTGGASGYPNHGGHQTYQYGPGSTQPAYGVSQPQPTYTTEPKAGGVGYDSGAAGHGHTGGSHV